MEPRIYIAAHKPFFCPDNNMYIPIFAGKAFHPNLYNNYIGDNTGNNISHLNKTLCELTVLYWVWKNTDDNLVGINHYRRYFSPKEKSISTYKYIDQDGNTSTKQMLAIAANDDFQEFERYNIDMLTVSHTSLGSATIEENYAEHHNAEDWVLLRSIIKNQYPEYIDFFDFFSKQHKMSTLNIFLTKRNVLNDYCEWLFNIMLEMVDMPFYHNYTPYQQRVLGFLAERLFNVWMLRNRSKYKFMFRDVYSVETSI